jgi:hypothetical protein
MKEEKKQLENSFFAGFQSVFEFNTWFKPRPICEAVQGTEYLKSLIKGPEEDAINLRNDWKNILSSDFNQGEVARGRRYGRAQYKNHKNRKSAK